MFFMINSQHICISTQVFQKLEIFIQLFWCVYTIKCATEMYAYYIIQYSYTESLLLDKSNYRQNP